MTDTPSAVRRRIAVLPAGAALLALVGCSTSTPARLVLPSGDVLRGSATTNLNGQFYVKNDRVNCTGTYEGRSIGGLTASVGRKSAVTVRCSNGKTGSSDDPLYETGQARLTLSDGSKAQITLSRE